MREEEVWKVVNEVTKPREAKTWTLNKDQMVITDDKEIAEIFNDYFIKKIENLKMNIHTEQIKDPTKKLQEKVKTKNLHFSLKTVTVMDGMKKKKSAGRTRRNRPKYPDFRGQKKLQYC